MSSSIKITERWSVRADPHQWILEEHYLTKGGRNPRTGEEAPPRMATRETYHAHLSNAVHAAIEAEGKGCESLDALAALTQRWKIIAMELEDLLT